MAGAGAPLGSARDRRRRPATDPVAAPQNEKTAKSRKKSPMPLWQETILLLALALVLAIVIKYFFVQAFYIPSPSMEPQFIKERPDPGAEGRPTGAATPRSAATSWCSRTPAAGSSRRDADADNPLTKLLEKIGLYPSGGHLVKRVIGIGGDRVEVLRRPRAASRSTGTRSTRSPTCPRAPPPSADRFDVHRAQGHHLWVMGDNRGDSFDSRGHMGGPGGGFVASRPRGRQGVGADLAVEPGRAHPPSHDLRGRPVVPE